MTDLTDPCFLSAEPAKVAGASPVFAAPRVITGDRPAAAVAGDKLPVVLVLDRLRSAFNVGNIFRLADAVGAEAVVTCGYTAAPPHPKLAKSARGCDAIVPTSRAESAAQAVAELQARGYTIYAVETAESATTVWETTFRFPAAFVLGNEALGVSGAALAPCDGIVRLPCRGVKNSVNVGNCAAVILYEALRQWESPARQTAGGGQ